MPDPGVPEFRPESWAELLEAVYEGAWNAQLGRFRPSVAFRGTPRDEFELRPGVTRFTAPGGPDVEAHLLRAFRKYAFGAATGESTWNWLALAQHHGLPTRLLDWSYSPLVALHFATSAPEDFDADGIMWCVNFERTNAFLPAPLARALSDEGSQVFTVELLDGVASDLAAFDALADEASFVVFLEPPSLDQRVVNQSALFSLASDSRLDLRAWFADRPGAARRVLLPAALKWEVRDKLDQAGVTERVLFPGLDGLSRWLTRYYMTRE